MRNNEGKRINNLKFSAFIFVAVPFCLKPVSTNHGLHMDSQSNTYDSEHLPSILSNLNNI